MSLTGMAVEIDTALKVGRNYSLTLRHGDGRELRLSGDVVWSHLRGLRRSDNGEMKTVYEAGVHFQEALSEQAAELAKMLEETAVVAVEKRISGRFQVNVPEPVSVGSDHHFIVKTISAVGLLIETEASPPLSSTIEVEVDLHGATLRSRGRVAHRNDFDGPDGSRRSQLGIEFVDASAEQHRTIVEFISRQLSSSAAAADA